jgi:hypothetical protein
MWRTLGIDESIHTTVLGAASLGAILCVELILASATTELCIIADASRL